MILIGVESGGMREAEAVYNRLLSRRYAEDLFSDLGSGKREGPESLTKYPFGGGHRFSYSREKPV